ncbi:MAG: LutB/LldF family L-lactate oxidation iron-sulfur protein [Chloroflexi bacterium]|nr:LutB/LldF family L-lactate oxidation iron-sulfur protein [Chloroflexota bacterium]
MSAIPTHIDFRRNVQSVEPQVPASVRKATTRFLDTRAAVVDVIGQESWQALRQAGHDVRLHTINHLDYYLARLEEEVTRAGGHVHWARDAQEANRIVLEIAQEHRVKRVVKAKSMVTEEIGLNRTLVDAGVQTLETDLGEYIVQLAGTGPSHIMVPAIHLTKEGIADLFREKLGLDALPEAARLAALARAQLRQEFLAADMGITGANFLVAETGTLVLVTNEGNGRMCTTLPPLHVAVAGIDKVVPDLESLNVLLKLLPRSATGQKMSAYTAFITGPRRTEEENGPKEFHLVLLDNGRTIILQDEITRETLLCIRCGACLNVCPVYNHVGGHAYGFAYSGPIGAILLPQLVGTKVAADLPFASSLCGACADICPVKIPIVEILLRLRRRVVEGDTVEPAVSPATLRLGVQMVARAMSIPWLYDLAGQLLRIAQAPFRRGAWLPSLPPPLNRWTMARPLPALRADWRAAWRRRTPEGRTRQRRIRIALVAALASAAAYVGWRLIQRQDRGE